MSMDNAIVRAQMPYPIYHNVIFLVVNWVASVLEQSQRATLASPTFLGGLTEKYVVLATRCFRYCDGTVLLQRTCRLCCK